MKNLTLFTFALTLSACGGDKEDSDTSGSNDTDSGSADTDPATVYDGLGGAAGVTAVVSQFIANVAVDPNVNWMFADTDIANLQMQLENQICEATGGGCTYTGGTMAVVHADMAITDAQFTFVVVDLLNALDSLDVPYTAGTFDGGLPADALMGALASMQGDIVTDPAGSSFLFNQIGGNAAVHAVVDEFIAVVAADTRINSFFASTDIPMLNALLVEQICDATGGYCTYSGRSMCDTHAGMGVDDAAFDALVDDLLIALENLGVPYALDGTATIDPLLFALVGMHDEIVEPQAACP